MGSPSKKTAHASEQGRADVLERRRRWFAGQLDLDPAKLVFLDETGASTNLARKGTLPAWTTAARRCPARSLQDSDARRRHPSSRPCGAEGLRSADHRSFVRGMGGGMLGSYPRGRRYRRHGQFAEPQGDAGRRAHKSRRGRTAISAALQPRHEPDRKSLFQAEGILAQTRRANRHRIDEGARNLRRHLQTRPNAEITSLLAAMIQIDRIPLL